MIAPLCDFCSDELTEFGAILLSPPDPQGLVRKFHVCVTCYGIAMSLRKQQIRTAFFEASCKATGYRCIGCNVIHNKTTAKDTLDVHHITPREEFENGGYVKENGAPLCKLGDRSCHMKAEEWLKNGTGQPGFSPEELYAKIGSSRDKAMEADKRLK